MKKISVLILIGVIMTLAIGRASTNSFQDDVKQYIAYGWMDEPEVRTWAYVETITTADADVYLVHINEDVTGLIGPNLKVRLYNPTVKYFGILSVGAYADGVTPVYLFGGKDYVLDGLEAISNVSFSSARAPIGFPMNPDKWSIVYSDSTLQFAGSLANDTWVNINNASLRLPPGLWDVGYKVSAEVLCVSYATAIILSATLSDADNTSIAERENFVHIVGSVANYRNSFFHNKTVELSAEQTYYLNTKYYVTGATVDYLANGGDATPTVIRAVWGGL